MSHPTLKEIMTWKELAKVNELRVDLLQSVSSWEREYYHAEIQKIFEKARERYWSEQEKNTSSGV